MIKLKSYKIKNRVLPVGGLLFVIVAYNVAIRKTIDVCIEASRLQKQLQVANDAPAKINTLRKENERMDQRMGHKNDDFELQQALLSFVTNYCKENKLVLEDFPKPIVGFNKDIIIETNIITVEGKFEELQQMDYLLEQKMKIGKVAAVHYKVSRNYDTKKSNLTLTIYIQNIKKNSHET